MENSLRERHHLVGDRLSAFKGSSSLQYSRGGLPCDRGIPPVSSVVLLVGYSGGRGYDTDVPESEAANEVRILTISDGGMITWKNSSQFLFFLDFC